MKIVTRKTMAITGPSRKQIRIMKRILLGSLFSLMIVHANAMVSQPDTIGLDEVVVTALGVRREEKRLG